MKRELETRIENTQQCRGVTELLERSICIGYQPTERLHIAYRCI